MTQDSSNSLETAACKTCRFSNLLVQAGEVYTFTNVVGDEVERTHAVTVLECRAMPPVAGGWPQVQEDDWCGHYG